MGRHVLPAGEKALFVLNWLARRVSPNLKPYVPDFRRAFDHFCLHAGAPAPFILRAERSLVTRTQKVYV